jgi:hypothetical protein
MTRLQMVLAITAAAWVVCCIVIVAYSVIEIAS